MRAASLGSNEKLKNSLNRQLDELYTQKKEIEDAISRAVFNRTLDDVFTKQDVLTQFGVKRDTTPQVDQKKQEQEAKELAQRKEAAQKYIDTIAESNMSEMQLEGKHYNESHPVS